MGEAPEKEAGVKNCIKKELRKLSVKLDIQRHIGSCKSPLSSDDSSNSINLLEGTKGPCILVLMNRHVLLLSPVIWTLSWDKITFCACKSTNLWEFAMASYATDKYLIDCILRGIFVLFLVKYE